MTECFCSNKDPKDLALRADVQHKKASFENPFDKWMLWSSNVGPTKRNACPAFYMQLGSPGCRRVAITKTIAEYKGCACGQGRVPEQLQLMLNSQQEEAGLEVVPGFFELLKDKNALFSSVLHENVVLGTSQRCGRGLFATEDLMRDTEVLSLPLDNCISVWHALADDSFTPLLDRLKGKGAIETLEVETILLLYLVHTSKKTEGPVYDLRTKILDASSFSELPAVAKNVLGAPIEVRKFIQSRLSDLYPELAASLKETVGFLMELVLWLESLRGSGDLDCLSENSPLRNGHESDYFCLLMWKMVMEQREFSLCMSPDMLGVEADQLQLTNCWRWKDCLNVPNTTTVLAPVVDFLNHHSMGQVGFPTIQRVGERWKLSAKLIGTARKGCELYLNYGRLAPWETSRFFGFCPDTLADLRWGFPLDLGIRMFLEDGEMTDAISEAFDPLIALKLQIPTLHYFFPGHDHVLPTSQLDVQIRVTARVSLTLPKYNTVDEVKADGALVDRAITAEATEPSLISYTEVRERFIALVKAKQAEVAGLLDEVSFKLDCDDGDRWKDLLRSLLKWDYASYQQAISVL